MVEHKKYKVKMNALFGSFILASFETESEAEDYLDGLRKDIKENSYVTKD